MNLVMLDIDGTLTQSYEYDREIFGLAIAEVLGCQTVDADLNLYVDKTSIGVTQEAIRQITGRNAREKEIEEVKRRVLWHLTSLYQKSPEYFGEVPGASRFMERLRKFDGAGIAIATGCWLKEALFKLKASGLAVDGIPIATSDDHRDRKRIMEIAAKKARDMQGISGFEHVVYLGDGPWDIQASHSLGYSFIGIGPRIQEFKKTMKIHWFLDFLEIEAVFATIAAAFESWESPS